MTSPTESNNSETSSEVLLRDIYNLPSLKTIGDQSWREHARCKGLSVDLFFPKKEDIKNSHVTVAKSRLICAGCPVRKECLHFAMDNIINHGLYGGVMPRERRGKDSKSFNGDLLFSQVLQDFKRLNNIKATAPLPTEMYSELAKAINKPLSVIKEMMKDPNTAVLKSGS